MPVLKPERSPTPPFLFKVWKPVNQLDAARGESGAEWVAADSLEIVAIRYPMATKIENIGEIDLAYDE